MTAWTVEPSEPLHLSLRATDMVAKTKPATLAVVSPEVDSKTWIIQAYLSDALSSAMSKPGETIKATVAEPIYNADHTIAVPQGATIVGAVTKARPARSFGRGGTLHFDFRQLILPGGNAQNVRASLIGADSSAPDKLALDSEDQVKPKPQGKLLVPFTLLVLAARPLDVDKGDGAGGGFGKDAVASNSLGVIGFIIGTLCHSEMSLRESVTTEQRFLSTNGGSSVGETSLLLATLAWCFKQLHATPQYCRLRSLKLLERE